MNTIVVPCGGLRRSLGLLLFWMGLIACSGTDDPDNLLGTVLLDEEIVQGVGLRVADTIGNEAETTTDAQGEYGFLVLPGDQTVRLISGLPDDVECSPGIEQTVDVPLVGTATADFACESGGGGAGGAGGEGGDGGNGATGGSGGTGGSDEGCGVAQSSPTFDLAGNVSVSPMSGPEGTMINVSLPVTAGAREVFVTFAITNISASIGGGFAITPGAETVDINFNATPQQGDPAARYPAIIEIVGIDPTMGVFYITTDDLMAVERSTRNGDMFTPPELQPDCTPVYFELTN